MCIGTPLTTSYSILKCHGGESGRSDLSTSTNAGMKMCELLLFDHFHQGTQSNPIKRQCLIRHCFIASFQGLGVFEVRSVYCLVPLRSSLLHPFTLAGLHLFLPIHPLSSSVLSFFLLSSFSPLHFLPPMFSWAFGHSWHHHECRVAPAVTGTLSSPKCNARGEIMVDARWVTRDKICARHNACPVSLGWFANWRP